MKGLLRCRRGAAIVEFALLAPALLAMIFGIIELGRVLWMRQTLDTIAFATARCTAIDSACDTGAEQLAYALAQAGGYGVAVGVAGVSVAGDTSCNGYPDSAAARIEAPFASPLVGLVPGLPALIAGEACYPRLGSGDDD